MPEKLVIIGSGPAAWTAAIYAARANLSPLVYQGAITFENQVTETLPLGQLNYTSQVDNFPGFAEGVLGPKLMIAMRSQAERFGTRAVFEDVVDADLSRHPFVIKDSVAKTFETEALIIASGGAVRYLGLESERRYWSAGVTADVVSDCPLPRFRNKPFIVVGGGDSACDACDYVSRFVSEIHVVHRRDTLNRATRILANPVLANPKVQPHWNSIVEEVLGKMVVAPRDGKEYPSMTGARIKNLKTGETTTIEAAGMYVAIGHTPNTKFLNGQLETDDKGFIKLADPSRTATSVEGVFAAGFVADPIYRQAITAAAMGCKAAMDAERWLVGREK